MVIEWAACPAGVKVLRPSTLQKNAHLVLCHHAPEFRGARIARPVRESDPLRQIGEICNVCKGDDQTTHGFAWAVKMIVVLNPKLAPEPVQEALF